MGKCKSTISFNFKVLKVFKIIRTMNEIILPSKTGTMCFIRGCKITTTISIR